MKIIHSSDWHLGQSFFCQSRKNEHQAFLTWLLEQIDIHQVDAVIVAGDIFDTGTPPSYARSLYNQFVSDISKRHCKLIILGGNHDSVATLNESKSLLNSLGTHVIASTTENDNDSLIQVNNKQGEVAALVCAIPFIRPRDLVNSQAGETGLEKQQNLAQAIKQYYHANYQSALEFKQQHKLNVPIIATGHLTALGVKQSESVRDIYIGTLDGFDAAGFPPADYIALGHIHRPQVVAKKEHIRYSGSPIPLSFDEIKTAKQVLLVEFCQDKLEHIQAIEIPSFQAMTILKGNLLSIEQQLSQLDPQQLTWLCIEVDIDDYLSDLQSKVQDLCKDLNVEVLQLKRTKKQGKQQLTQEFSETLAELSPQEVFEKRLALENFDEKPQVRENLQGHFQGILNELETNTQHK